MVYRCGRGMRAALIFAVGAVGYPMLELIWRGETHVLMSLAGGVCLLAIYAISRLPRRLTLPAKALFGAAVITSVELAIGLVANRGLGMDIWDYSHLPLNFMGQICLLFSVVWFLLCLMLLPLCSRLRASFDSAERQSWT